MRAMASRSRYLGAALLLALTWSAPASAGQMTPAAVRTRVARDLNANREWSMSGLGQWFPRTPKWNIEVSKPNPAGWATYRATLKTPFISAHVPQLTQITGKYYVVTGKTAALDGEARHPVEATKRRPSGSRPPRRSLPGPTEAPT